MRELALFAGGGGGLLASQHLLGFKTVCYVEIDAYCVEILKARIRDGLLDDSPIWNNARTFDGRAWRGRVDLITAGFPCQPWSVAGKQKGKRDDRNLWPDTIRICREVKTRFIFLENVPALLAGSHGYFGQILGDLSESGYDARWCVLSAAGCGAPHLRKRLWILAYARDGRWRQLFQQNRQSRRDTEANFGSDGEIWNVADSNPERLQGESTEGGSASRCRWWETESVLGRVVDGIPYRVHRLKALGNAQVPAVAAKAWSYLAEGGEP